jgi:hypothetical protein
LFALDGGVENGAVKVLGKNEIAPFANMKKGFFGIARTEKLLQFRLAGIFHEAFTIDINAKCVMGEKGVIFFCNHTERVLRSLVLVGFEVALLESF